MLNISIILIPLLSSIFSGFFGKFIGKKGSTFLSTFSIFICFSFLFKIYKNIIINNSEYYLKLFTWINSGLFYCNWAFIFDTLTIVMLIVVLTISFLVHLYSCSYMENDPHLSRFMSYLSLFTFFMLILVTSDNFIQMFVGWEGVGFCSYLLINFWFTRLQANKAAIKAMLVNRIGDFFLILGILVLFVNFKSVEYSSVFATIPLIKNFFFNFLNTDFNIIYITSLLLLLGAMGKSAQLFLHTWLPDAMEGPTPVSALIHAATMVTAGVFLIVRCSPLFEYSSDVLCYITVIGSMTAFFAGTVGLTQNDLKKVIAYSTCSQLGYMFFSCGISNYNISIFHLSNHAFFKALLFLSAGVVIHALQDEQDMRKMGGLRRILPFTYNSFVIGSLALMGFPFLTGFYSKDPILEIAYASFTNQGHFSFLLGTLAAFFTAFYSMRLLYLTFLNKSNAYKYSIVNAHEASILMGFPLFILSFGSIFIGYLCKDMFIGLGSDFWNNSIYIHPFNVNYVDAEFLPVFLKNFPLIISLSGLFFAFILYNYNFKYFSKLKMSKNGIFLYTFLNRKWFFDKIYNENINQSLLNISFFKTYKVIDRGVIEILGPYGLSKNINNIGFFTSLIQTGFINNYSIFFFLSFICLFFLT